MVWEVVVSEVVAMEEVGFGRTGYWPEFVKSGKQKKQKSCVVTAKGNEEEQYIGE